MFIRISRFVHGFILIVVLSACQPAAVPATVTPPPEPPPDTSTPTHEPAQPIPSADFLPEDVIGIWTRSDPDRGTLFILINSDGSYAASHGTPQGIVHSGSYTLDGRLFTFVDGWNCSPKETTPGQYILHLSAGRYIYFEPYNDTCPDRPRALKSYRWDRVELTPVP